MDCIHCPRTFDTARALSIHVSKTHKGKALLFKTCSDCGEKFGLFKSEFQ
eukprot:GAHX01002269.1.p1 GENE.GAHX01002269.1~~GAHX01002269.1.p1  ORF type:complete len:60 (+),score=5.97 GAHX01002269.1:33-182(+)